MASISQTGYLVGALFLLSCRTSLPVTDSVRCSFRVNVREKYCLGARADEARRQAYEREKPYASQPLFLVNRDSKAMFTFSTDETGRATGHFPPGDYDLYLPEKKQVYPEPNTRCREWQARPDTGFTLRADETLTLSLKRSCNPCLPSAP